MRSPQELGLPEKFKEFRPVQIAIVDKFLSVSGNLLADAPTGTGKTIIATALQRELNVPATYITPNKSLQYQVCNEIPYARMIMGRANYDCLLYEGLKADACVHTKDDPCHFVNECPYRLARKAAEHSQLAVLNSSYYLYASNYARKFERPLLIVDEVDQFEGAVLDFVSLKLTLKNLQQLASLGCLPESCDTPRDWTEWAAAARPKILPLTCLSESPTRKEVVGAEEWKRILGKLDFLLKNVDDTWFTDDSEDSITFRPVVVSKYTNRLVWSHHDRVLGMSGSVLNPNIVAGDLGMKADYIQVDSTFPVDNRPLYNLTGLVGGLNKSNLNANIPLLADLTQRIIDAYPDGKVLVHTQSYALARGICDELADNRTVMNENSRDRQVVLNDFLASSEPLVLVSPSFSRGLDLAGDRYPCVIVLKAPFASLGSEAVMRRKGMPGGQEWYDRDATAALMQMCGRGVRSDTDKCDTFILDAACLRLINKCPNWFRRALRKYEQT